MISSFIASAAANQQEKRNGVLAENPGEQQPLIGKSAAYVHATQYGASDLQKLPKYPETLSTFEIVTMLCKQKVKTKKLSATTIVINEKKNLENAIKNETVDSGGSLFSYLYNAPSNIWNAITSCGGCSSAPKIDVSEADRPVEKPR